MLPHWISLGYARACSAPVQHYQCQLPFLDRAWRWPSALARVCFVVSLLRAESGSTGSDCARASEPARWMAGWRWFVPFAFLVYSIPLSVLCARCPPEASHISSVILLFFSFFVGPRPCSISNVSLLAGAIGCQGRTAYKELLSSTVLSVTASHCFAINRLYSLMFLCHSLLRIANDACLPFSK